MFVKPIALTILVVVLGFSLIGNAVAMIGGVSQPTAKEIIKEVLIPSSGTTAEDLERATQVSYVITKFRESVQEASGTDATTWCSQNCNVTQAPQVTFVTVDSSPLQLLKAQCISVRVPGGVRLAYVNGDNRVVYEEPAADETVCAKGLVYWQPGVPKGTIPR